MKKNDEPFTYHCVIRLTSKDEKRLRKLCRTSRQGINNQIVELIREGCGIFKECPTIVKGEGNYFFLSPLGHFGELDSLSLRRFFDGNVPFTRDRWDDEFETMEEACEALGEIVCVRNRSGVYVSNYELFGEMAQKVKLEE